MQDGVVVGNMTMGEFKHLKHAGPPVTPQRIALREMSVGEVIVLKHGERGCGYKGGGKHCAIASAVQLVGRERSLRFQARHLEDGNVAVACVAKPE